MKSLQALILVVQLIQVLTEYISISTTKCNESNVKRSSQDGDGRWSVLKDGDFIIQGIIPLGEETTSSDSKIERIGLLSMLSLEFAIHNMNKDNSILPGYELGYQIDNSCYSIPTVMARGIEIVSQFRSQSVCYSRKCTDDSATVKKITAVIGTQNSFTSIPLASLLALYKIPQISPTASSRLLSKKSLYPSFFRTTPSDVDQVAAIADFLKYFSWHYVYAIGSDDNYGKLGINSMKEYASKMDFCIVEDEYISHLDAEMKAKAKTIAKRLKSLPNAAVVVLFAYNQQIELITREAEHLGLNRIWLMSDAFDLFESKDINIKESTLVGMFRVSPITRQIPGLRDFIRKKITTEATCNKFLELYLKQTFNCKINKTVMNCGNRTLTDIVNVIDNSRFYNYAFGHITDGLHAVVHAMRRLLTKMCKYNQKSYSKNKCPPFTPINPEELTRELFAINFTTFYNETFTFDGNGDPTSVHYYIQNLQKINGVIKFVEIGQWDRQDRLHMRREKIVWPFWAGKTSPRSSCNDDCKPGEHVSAKTECCWSCQRCSIDHVSKQKNMANCTKCPTGYSSNKQRTECMRNIFVILTAKSAAGISIIAINSLGVILTIAVCIGYHMYLKETVMRMPQHHYTSIVLLITSFVYGNLLMLERTKNYCNVNISISSVILSGYGVVLLAKTHLFVLLVSKGVQPVLRLSMNYSHSCLMVFITLIHIVLLASSWVYYPLKSHTHRSTDSREISVECGYNFNPLQLVSFIFYPLFLLTIATIVAFRERGDPRNQEESKFLNFTTIALGIVVVAFFPTFRFVSGMFRDIVMAYTMDVFAFTYIGCFLFPKLYVVFASKNKGKTKPVTADNTK